jgi:phage terminase large subunit-like protein
LSLGTASQGAHAAWIVPIYKNGRAIWRWVQNTVAPLQSAGLCQVSKTDRVVEFNNGGLFGVYSADNEDGVRGEAFHLVVLDEAARISETAWNDAIMPTLADYNGEAILISTPRGRNWFWNEYQRGLSDNKYQASWTAPTSANPSKFIKHAAEMARLRIPELTYRQEWMGEFVDMAGSVFRRIQDAATVQPIDAALPGRQYAAGVDVAASVDYTVICVLDVQSRQMVFMDRFNRVDYGALEDRLVAVNERFHLASMTVETNSIGAPVIDALYSRGLPIIPFTTTSATKQTAITGLQSAFEHGEISIINDTVLIGELLSFESKRNASGSFSYSAPDGMHDDCVLALAIAWQSISGENWITS